MPDTEMEMVIIKEGTATCLLVVYKSVFDFTLLFFLSFINSLTACDDEFLSVLPAWFQQVQGLVQLSLLTHTAQAAGSPLCDSAATRLQYLS